MTGDDCSNAGAMMIVVTVIEVKAIAGGVLLYVHIPLINLSRIHPWDTADHG